MREVTGTTLAECEQQLTDGERIVHTQGSRVTGQVVCQVESDGTVQGRINALAHRRVCGPDYSRAVAENLRDAELFLSRGDADAALHYVLHAERAVGLISWDELEAADPFRRHQTVGIF